MSLVKVAIHGVPRSGTTWLGSIFDSSPNVIYRNQPLFSYAFKSYLSEHSSKQEVNKFFNLLHDSDDDFLNQKELKEKGLIPTFNKNKVSHIIYKEARYHNILNNLVRVDEDVKVIGIVRDPRSVIYSWKNAPKEFDARWDLMNEWEKAELKNKGKKEEFYGYIKWKEVALMFLSLKKKFPSQFYLLSYKDLLEHTELTTKQLFEFCNIKYGEQTHNFITTSKAKDMSNEAYSVYRTKLFDNSWKGILPYEISESIKHDLKGTPLELFIS